MSDYSKPLNEVMLEVLKRTYGGNTTFTTRDVKEALRSEFNAKGFTEEVVKAKLLQIGAMCNYLIKTEELRRVSRGCYELVNPTKTTTTTTTTTTESEEVSMTMGLPTAIQDAFKAEIAKQIQATREEVEAEMRALQEKVSSSEQAALKAEQEANRLRGLARPELQEAVETVSVTPEDGCGVFKPTPSPSYYLNDSATKMFNVAYQASRTTPQNIKLAGPHGVGKTEMAIQFAARHEMPILIMDCANVREARDWFGYKTVEDGDVIWKQSQFDKTVSEGNHVILLDEINRTSPNVLNTLLPLLDGRRFTYVEEKGGIIEVGPGTVFFCTMNEGAGYTGTNFMDLALNDRFTRVMELDYLPEDKEVEVLVKRTAISKTHARNLVDIANKVRAKAKGLSATFSSSISTRQLLGASLDFQISGPKSLEYTLANHFSRDGGDSSERSAVYQLIQGKYGDGFAA